MDNALAIATVVLALFTAWLASSTRRMARAGEQEAELMRTQISRAHRPVLVPFQQSGEKVRFRGGEIEVGLGPHISENPPDRDDLPRYSAAMVAIVNVGMGPALNVRGEYTGPRGQGDVRFPVVGIAAGEKAVVVFETWTDQSLGYTGNDPSVSAVIEYDDVAGQTYRTDVTFDVGSGAYRSSVAAEFGT